jgi:hypothetical protein
MSSRMFRISSSRLGAHTSRMGDISGGLGWNVLQATPSMVA